MPEPLKKEPVRNGVNKSLYISTVGDEILTQCEKSTRRSQSEIVSLLIEKYGPEIAKDPRSLNL